MQKTSLQKSRILALAIAGILVVTPALADNRKGDGGNKNSNKHEQTESHDSQRDNHGEGHGHSHFDDHHRSVMHDYYTEQYRSGHCPPGLAKKHNGCLPPGQAKRWQIGQPLPREVIFYDLPREVVIQLGPPPSRHRYVRVANDILMIAVGTGMVVDAIDDLGRY